MDSQTTPEVLRTPTQLTPEETDQVIADYKKKLPLGEINQKHRLKLNSVHSIIKNHKIPLNSPHKGNYGPRKAYPKPQSKNLAEFSLTFSGITINLNLAHNLKVSDINMENQIISLTIK